MYAMRLTAIFTILAISSLLSACFPHKAGSHLGHFHEEAPAEGEAAPDFKLTTIEGKTIQLSELIGSKPIVLQLGSHSCPVYRYRRFGMGKLYHQYKDKAHFLVVYTLEAHPKGAINPYVDREWVSSFNYLTNTIVPFHSDEEMRMQAAQSSHAKFCLLYTSPSPRDRG